LLLGADFLELLDVGLEDSRSWAFVVDHTLLKFHQTGLGLPDVHEVLRVGLELGEEVFDLVQLGRLLHLEIIEPCNKAEYPQVDDSEEQIVDL